MFAGSRSVSSRRALVMFGLSASLCAASRLHALPAQAQTPPPQTPPAQTPAPAAGAAQPAADDPFKFKADAAVIANFVKADKAADFESGWLAIRDKLLKSAKPEMKELAEGL